MGNNIGRMFVGAAGVLAGYAATEILRCAIEHSSFYYFALSATEYWYAVHCLAASASPEFYQARDRYWFLRILSHSLEQAQNAGAPEQQQNPDNEIPNEQSPNQLINDTQQQQQVPALQNLALLEHIQNTPINVHNLLQQFNVPYVPMVGIPLQLPQHNNVANLLNHILNGPFPQQQANPGILHQLLAQNYVPQNHQATNGNIPPQPLAASSFLPQQNEPQDQNMPPQQQAGFEILPRLLAPNPQPVLNGLIPANPFARFPPPRNVAPQQIAPRNVAPQQIAPPNVAPPNVQNQQQNLD